uniref:NAC domain-containing protein n=1 Tax=Physcomitrium patens TaxID=3218 RepID=A0A2K1KAP3_PHYPA|nr:hypothetical protein PHYPA_010033 [Physcomitrium patens]
MCSSKPRPTAQIDRYFFSRKGKKYPTGTRANLVTTMGFWEATGRDKPIHTKLNQTLIGMRKTLVFYQGCAPHGIKTDWNLREFSLDDRSERPTHDGGWVVCCVFKKNKNLKMEMQQERATSYEEQMGALPPEALGSPNSNEYLNSLHRELGYPSSLNRPDDVNYFMNLYPETSNSGLCEFNDPQTSSGSDGTELNHEETISGSSHNDSCFEDRSLSLPLGSWSSAKAKALRVIKEQADDMCFEDEMLRFGFYGIDHDRDCSGESLNGMAGQGCFNPKLQSTTSPKWVKVLVNPMTSRNRVFPSRSKDDVRKN